MLVNKTLKKYSILTFMNLLKKNNKNAMNWVWVSGMKMNETSGNS